MPTTANHTNVSPADTSTHQPVDGVISIDWTPTSGLNPISGTPTITGNGKVCVVTTSAIGGGGLRCTAIIPAYSGRLNSVTSVCTTQDTNANSYTWTFTTMRNWGAVSGVTDYVSNKRAPGDSATDYVSLGGAAAFGSGESMDYYCRNRGQLFSTDETVDYATMDRASGVLNSTDNFTDYYATDNEYANLLPIGTNVGEYGANPLPVGTNIEATDHALMLPVGTNISATDHVEMLPLGVNIGIDFDGALLPVGTNVGTFGQSTLPIGTLIERAMAELHVELFFASEALQGIEDEP